MTTLEGYNFHPVNMLWNQTPVSIKEESQKVLDAVIIFQLRNSFYFQYKVTTLSYNIKYPENLLSTMVLKTKKRW